MSRVWLTGSANRLVAEEYESTLEQAERNLQRHEAGAATEPSEVEKFTEANWQELLSLCQDLDALWRVATTTNRDRKQLIRTVVQTVIVEKRRREMIRARIVWVDSEADTVVEIKLAPYAHRMMAQLDARGLTSAAIARELNALSLVTTQGNLWSEPTVSQAVRVPPPAAVGTTRNGLRLVLEPVGAARRPSPKPTPCQPVSAACAPWTAGS
jgi:hypothetical protein